MNFFFLNQFMNRFTRERVVPTIFAITWWLRRGTSTTAGSFPSKCAKRRSTRNIERLRVQEFTGQNKNVLREKGDIAP